MRATIRITILGCLLGLIAVGCSDATSTTGGNNTTKNTLREKVRAALAAMNTEATGYSGVTGVTVFDKNGDCTKPAVVAEVIKGSLAKSPLQFSNDATREAAAAGGKALFVGGDGVFSPDFVRLAEGAAEGSYIITPYVNDTTSTVIAKFSRTFEAKHKEAPDAWAALTYDAVGTMALAVEKAIAEADSAELALIGNTVRFGLAGPFTGSNQKFGDMIHKGAEIKVEELNAKGGIAGRKIEIVRGDDEGSNSRAANVANDFVSDPRIVGIIGHFNSSCSKAAKNIYKNAGIPAISPGSTNVDVCAGSDYMFRNLYRDDFQGFLIAEFVKEKLKRTRVVVFYENDDYGAGLKEFFVQKAGEIGLTVAKEIPYDKKSSDFTSLVTTAKFEEPQVIFVAGLYEQAAEIVKACKNAGLTQ